MDSGGSVHLSLNGDYLGSAKLVAEILKNNRSKFVLELAAGKGVNTKYLAKKFSQKNFFAIDLPKGQFYPKKLSKLANIKADFGDFHDLRQFKDSTFDCVFIIEALCYANNQLGVMKEVNRILKQKGIFVIIQDNIAKKKYSETELYALKLLHAGVMSNFKDRTYYSLKTNLTKTGFKIVKQSDLTEALRPQMIKFETQARFFIKHRKFTKLLIRALPLEITANIISVYLLPALFEAKLDKYELVLAKK